MKTWEEILAELNRILTLPAEEMAAALAAVIEAMDALIAAATEAPAEGDSADAAAVEAAATNSARAMTIVTKIRNKIDQHRDLMKRAQDVKDLRNQLTTPADPNNKPPQTTVTVSQRKRTRFFNNDEQAYKFGQMIRAHMGNASAMQWLVDKGLQRTMSTANQASAGLLVPDEWEDVIVKFRDQRGIIRKIAKIKSMNSDVLKYRRQVSGPTGQFVGQGGTITTSGKLVYEDITLTAKQLAVGTEMYATLDEDTAISLADEFTEWAAYELARIEDECGFIGDATSTYGGILGAVKKFEKLVTDAGGTWATDAHKAYAAGVYVATGSTWASVTNSDLISLPARIANRAGIVPAYITSSVFYHEVMVPRAQAANGTTGTQIVDGVPQNVFNGYPVIICDALPTATAANTIPVLFGSGDAIDFGDRRGITFETDKNITTQVIQAVVTERFDINCVDFGNASATASERKRGSMAALALKN